MASRRQKRTEKRVATWWAERLAAAKGDPAEVGSVWFQRIRARIADRARLAQPAAWGIAIDRLEQLYQELEAITDGDISGKEISVYPAKR